MTHADDIADDFEPAPPDKLFMHYRRQLSAMLDGELSPDEAKFMLRRLQHDGELAACWERWQVCGDVLRGRGHALLPADFASRVAGAIKHDGKDTAATTAADATGARGARRRAMLRGSAALAASVAVVAFFVARQLPGDAGPAAPGAGTDPVATELASSPPPVSTPDPSALDQAAAALAATAAVAEVPRRTAERRSRGQSQRAASRVQQRIAQQQAPAMIAASQTGQAGLAAAASFVPTGAGDPDPFAARTEASPRPWPRAILPGLAVPAAGSLVASHGDAGNGVSSGFHPFEPRLPSRDPVLAAPLAGPQPEPGTSAPQALPAAEGPPADGMDPQP